MQTAATGSAREDGGTAREALRAHWPEYLMEAAGLASFMISACFATVVLEFPDAPLHQAIPYPLLRRALIGIAMGLTAVALICSPWGQRSGAHLNPAVTLTFYMLGKIRRWDALFYGLAQFAGGVAGVVAARLLAGAPLGDPAVNYAVTVPGPAGPAAAFAAEFAISFALMCAVLASSNSSRLARYTPFIAGALIALYIPVEAPLSGMSMNPARTFASASSAREWTALWLYFTAPPLAMLAAGQLYRSRRGIHAVFCAKLHHHNDARCIFRCNYAAMEAARNEGKPWATTITTT